MELGLEPWLVLRCTDFQNGTDWDRYTVFVKQWEDYYSLLPTVEEGESVVSERLPSVEDENNRDSNGHTEKACEKDVDAGQRSG